jgi:glycosyltransferase involved in cell wall biosynthesis
MLVWLITVGEPLPSDRSDERPLRTGLLASTLVAQGHEVVWWASTFDHNHKQRRFARNTTIQISDQLTLELLDGREYRRNISLARLGNHRDVAGNFLIEAAQRPRPDIIVCSLPTIELTLAAKEFARGRAIPVVYDLRDLHPDVYLQIVPRPLRPLVRFSLWPVYRQLRRALSSATGLIGITPSFLRWGLERAGRDQSVNDAVFGFGYPDLTTSPREEESAAKRLLAMGVDPNKRIIWFVGTYNRWIDLGPAIDVARMLHEEGDQRFQFVFSGRGDHAGEWQSRAAGLPNVVFTGWVTAPEISWMRHRSWAGLAAYRLGFNGVGNKIIEYMAGGVPVLLGMGEDSARMLSELQCGDAYDPRRSFELREIIERWARDDSMHSRLKTNARRAYEERFSASRVYGAYAEHLLSVFRRSGGAA